MPFRLVPTLCVGMLLWDAPRHDTIASMGQLPVGSLLQSETTGVTGRGASYQFIPTQSVGTSRCKRHDVRVPVYKKSRRMPNSRIH
ncbi:MAG: hypothetical protein HW390_3010 [Candidatus Brocadiaceae bacterium]|nr:hypothetical protein [Candidatus Brocadiaceae bacterium]